MRPTGKPEVRRGRYSRTAGRVINEASRTRLGLAACAVSVAFVFLPGCSGPSNNLPVYVGGTELPADDPAFPTQLQVKYLGAGGVILKRGTDVLVTAPFFSNPSIPRVAFGEIQARPDQIKRFIGPGGDGLAGAKAILVGHAHYDHLMDVPYIKIHYLPQATVYGSRTMKNTLAGDSSLNAADIVSVESDMGTDQQPGRWWPVGPRMRVMALKSEHAPIIAHLKFFEGSYDAPLVEIPKRAWGWREGQTLAYLVDFLGADGTTVDFRIHYQDAASTPPLGFPPPDGRRVDLAIVCMPGFDQVDGYPKGIIDRLNPRFVVIIHWEDFFALLPDDPKDLRTVPTENAEKFIALLQEALPQDASFTLPAPGAWMQFSPSGAH
jgi:hypothetical protein